MGYTDLRDWIEAVDELGELKRLSGASWDLELGAITEISARELGNQYSLLFDDIPGYPSGYRVMTNRLGSLKRMALTLGFPTDLDEWSFIERWRQVVSKHQPIPPREVATAPVLQNIVRDGDIDLLKFPVPRWHELDGGRFIGTADCIITRDREDNWINVGTYRVQVIDHDRVSLYTAAGSHGKIQIQKYLSRGEPCPVAMVFGQDPLMFMVAGTRAPTGLSEYDYAGGFRGTPLEILNAPYTGLPIPASAEIAVEGQIMPGEEANEGPFGEFTGYYAGGERPEPVVRLRTLMYRDDPIITGALPARPPTDSTYWQRLMRPALIWSQMEQAGVPDVRGVWTHHPGATFFIVVAIKQRYAGHAKQAALVASQCRSAAEMGKWVVVVDDDIDVRSIEDVLWAMSTRCDPARDVEIIHDTWSQRLDPMQHDNLSSKVIVNACKPFSRLETFPKTAEVSPELRRQTLAKWATILQDGGRQNRGAAVSVPAGRA
jgi:4-hydroxy-3-polyprenylbenzoate decarboxylase